MVRIRPNVEIADDELRLTFVPSRGPGGQNINKVSTTAVLTFDLLGSQSLSDEQRARVRRALRTRINRLGLLRLRCGVHRSQAQNRREVIERFVRLMDQALKRPKPRRATRPTAASVKRRLQEKRRRGAQKQSRRSVRDDE